MTQSNQTTSVSTVNLIIQTWKEYWKDKWYFLFHVTCELQCGWLGLNICTYFIGKIDNIQKPADVSLKEWDWTVITLSARHCVHTFQWSKTGYTNHYLEIKRPHIFMFRWTVPYYSVNIFFYLEISEIRWIKKNFLTYLSKSLICNLFDFFPNGQIPMAF